jgi:glucuronoarabinoxylan endo-1,4-beta-xylanase
MLLAVEHGVQARHASVRMDASNMHQQITGFGGFVCSPQFTYGHMSTADIKKVWGTGSTVGCNIMRLYIPIGRNAWSQSLSTAKNAKQMGLIVFASPWGQPAEWKTNNSSDAKTQDGVTGKLKRENWADYAQYLEDYVQYLRQNGVELDAISIQNEPDWPAQYAGCLWDASEIAEFVKTYGRTISCKVMAPETLAVSDSYANALNASDVADCFDIYGGHQYGGIQSAYKNLAKKGKQIWMTEYLINWNEAENNTRSFDFSKDFFNFFRAINVCMLGDFNAWIHYAAKRYYGMLGDGQRGTTASVVTKRGYIMAHFAKFVTGMTRIEASFADDGAVAIEGSAYLSQTGDTVVAVIANPSDEACELTLDLPFYTQQGTMTTTTKTKSFTKTALTPDTETCRPVAGIAAQSVCTLLFTRSRDRQQSAMKGGSTRFNRIEDQRATKTAFGTGYKISNKTKTFDHSNPLFSSRTNAGNGYVQFDDRYAQLVLQVKSVSSTMNLSSSQNTLIYVNAKGDVATHDYGDIDLNRGKNFSLVFDLSPATLPDGCRGIISLTNNNWTSKLTLTLGDVYLSNGSLYSAILTGAYVADDSYVLDYSSDASCTSIDMTAVTELPATLPWLSDNRVVYVAEGSPLASQPNVVVGDSCRQLLLTAGGGHFRPKKAFSADAAQLTCQVDGFRLLMLPFTAAVPAGAKAYSVSEGFLLERIDTIAAHQPVLVEADGEIVFSGKGTVAYATSSLTAHLRGTYTAIPLFAGDYVLARQGEEWGFKRLTADDVLSPFDVYLQWTAATEFIPLDFSTTGVTAHRQDCQTQHAATFNLMGQKVNAAQRGIIVRDGRKYMVK